MPSPDPNQTIDLFNDILELMMLHPDRELGMLFYEAIAAQQLPKEKQIDNEAQVERLTRLVCRLVQHYRETVDEMRARLENIEAHFQANYRRKDGSPFFPPAYRENTAVLEVQGNKREIRI